MVEVFKTNVTEESDAILILSHIHVGHIAYEANFDLQDCDHILRVKSVKGNVKSTKVIRLINGFGFRAEVLAEEVKDVIMMNQSNGDLLF